MAKGKKAATTTQPAREDHARELAQARAQQAATAEILRIIASSPSDVQPVFDAIVESASRLFGTNSAIMMRDDSQVALRSVAGPLLTPAMKAGLQKLFPIPYDPAENLASYVIANCRVLEIPDTEASDLPVLMKEMGRAANFRAAIMAPLMRGDVSIGAIGLSHPQPGFRLDDGQLALLRTFADQAVIAIENARLFNETKDALERQTATGEILSSMSGSMADTNPVFEAIVRNLLRLFGTSYAVVALIRDGKFELAGFKGDPGWEKIAEAYPMPVDDQTIIGEVAIVGQVKQYAPIVGDPTAPQRSEQLARKFGFNAIMAAPMLREGKAIGIIMTARRNALRFDDRQVALIKSFADQAVIAIENMRLFNETKEALEQQTATAEILKVISESPTDTQPVFDAIVNAGLKLFPDAAVVLCIPQGGKVRMAAVANTDPEASKVMMSRFPIPFARGWMHAEAILDGEFINFGDAEQEKTGRYGEGVKNFLASGFRAITIVPMMAGESAIGAISVSRPKAGALTEKQIALLRTFAAQAVIAIENVRVFKELEARTGALSRSVEQLTALGEVGAAVSSTLDLETVLKTIVQRAVQLTGLDGGSIYEYDEPSQEFRLRAAENLSDEIVTVLRDTPMRSGEGVIGHAMESGEPAEIPDMMDDSYQSPRRDTLIQAGYRALLVVPLRRDEHIVGALAVNRKSPGYFQHDVIAILKTFATQSALAIQNARLFREIEQKGRELQVASHHKSNFLASMSHELRTPLNAILGFNEMILGQVYGEVPADMREPLQDIQQSGKHLLRLINNVLDLAKIEAGRMELALSDYSVSDAVEGVRTTLRPLAAEKGLELLASVPADLPVARGDPGRISQCLMNLAGNALKFTRAGRVEISVSRLGERLRFQVADTGIGIRADKIGSLFTEFRQTDATVASEYGGTGLGLSISRKFVEMHGGRIWVESEPGRGSTFIFEVPLRVNA
jgi:signal transduction histidine kinase